MPFEIDAEGFAINPETGVRFKYGENYQGKFFNCYDKRRELKPQFYSSVEAFHTASKKGKNLNRTPRECAFQLRQGVYKRTKDVQKEREEKGLPPMDITIDIDIDFLTENIEKGYYDMNGNLVKYYQVVTKGDRSRDYMTPSLDRLDSSCRDYIYTRTVQNCQLVPWVINNARSDFDNDYEVASVLYSWSRDTLLTELCKRLGRCPSSLDKTINTSLDKTINTNVEKKYNTFENITEQKNLDTLNNEEFLNCSQMWIDSNCI